MTARVIALVALAAACGGRHKPGGDPPTDPIPRPHADSCWWAGNLEVTVMPTDGDFTCIVPWPVDVELHAEPKAAPTDAGLVIEAPPAAIGRTTTGIDVTVQGAIDQCRVVVNFSSAHERFDPARVRHMFATAEVEQDRGTRRVTGRGSVAAFCDDNKCRQCRANIMVDGTIVPSE